MDQSEPSRSGWRKWDHWSRRLLRSFWVEAPLSLVGFGGVSGDEELSQKLGHLLFTLCVCGV